MMPGRDSGTSKTSISDFYIGSVDNTLDGYPYVDGKQMKSTP